MMISRRGLLSGAAACMAYAALPADARLAVTSLGGFGGGGAIATMTLVQSANNSRNGGSETSITLTYGTAPTDGNLMVAALAITDNTSKSFTTPAGWTQIPPRAPRFFR